MFEFVTTKTAIIWVLGWLVSKYIVPLILKKDIVKKAIKVVDRDTDVVEAADADFDWRTAQPKQYRPFKPIYHITMGISSTKEADYLLMENNYLDTVKYRAKIAEEQPSETCMIAQEPQVSKKCAQETQKAIEELYDYVVKYMLKKYPAYFVATGNQVTNLVTNDVFPRTASKRSEAQSTRDLLKVLCANVEEDFLLLQHVSQQDDEYVMRASTGIGANGFRFSEKLNKKLTDIHGPVPRYIEKLQLSMNRHFKRIQPGQFVQRLTWGIQIGGGMEQMFRPSGQHLQAGNQDFEEVDGTTLDFEKEAFVRVERQILTKLPKSRFNVLSVRTYMYSLASLKREGTAETLATAIRAFPDDVAHYKGRPRWGKAVLSYLDAV